MLARQDFGEGVAGTPLVIAHGLFGSGRNWGVIARRLSDTRPVVTVDMRNHGASPWTESHGYADLAGDLAELVPGAADLLGHSMGGKAVMQLALTAPDRVRKLVVADIAPVAYGHSQQRMIDAMRAVDLASVEKRSDADAQLAAHVDDPGVRAFLLQSLDVPGKAWRLNLATLETEMDRIVGWPGTPGRFDGPALFLSGANSDYVRPEHRDAISAQFPKARFARIPGAGHWLHAEKPREFEAAVRAFLDA
jgi:pimeloyl-ACP methyl ester carboxylesterase